VERRVRSATGRAFARAGLLGNPSDAYAGKAIAFSVRNFSARVSIEPSNRSLIQNEGAGPLLNAALTRYAAFTGTTLEPLRITVETDIPFQVGLAGSSAIVIAALRALAAAHGSELAPFDQAELALAVEAEDLGIAAGPMDRVVQAYEGLYLMDFRSERTPAAYTPLDPDTLPPMRIAWDPTGGAPSGSVHADTRERWQRGDPKLLRAMAKFSKLVDAGAKALMHRDFARLRSAVDDNFDQRCECFPVAERDREMVAIARARGAAAKQCGSGGACLAVLKSEEQASALEADYRRAGYETLCPIIEDPA
jgi:glucuronokinase